MLAEGNSRQRPFALSAQSLSAMHVSHTHSR
jgi:hypothetical protein